MKRARDDSSIDAVRGAVTDLVASGAVPMLGCLIAHQGEVLLDFAAGNARDGLALDSSSLIRIYSMTKPIVSVAVLMLVEEGAIPSLDAPLSSALPDWDDARVRVLADDDLKSVLAVRPITIRHLLTHTAGFAYGFMSEHTDKRIAHIATLYRQRALELPHSVKDHGEAVEPLPASLRDFVARLNEVPLARQPGERFEYSVATDVLGALIEAVTAEPLADFVTRRILAPLGMGNTRFVIGDADLPRLATCYRGVGKGEWDLARDGGIDATDARSPWYASSGATPRQLPSGGGGLVSTARDYLKFATMLARGGRLGESRSDGRLISEASMAEARREQLGPMGADHGGLMDVFQGWGLLGAVTVRHPGRATALPSHKVRGGCMIDARAVLSRSPLTRDARRRRWAP